MSNEDTHEAPPLSPEEVEALSPGIRDLVVALRAAGFHTTDSGDGSAHAEGMSCAVPYKMVAMLVGRDEMADETDRLADWFEANNPGWRAWQIQATYCPRSPAILVLCEVTEDQLDEIEGMVGRRPSGLVL